MRVKITYGVDVAKVPEKVQDIGHSGLSELHKAVQLLERSIDDIDNCEGDYQLILKLVDKARSCLTKADSILVDVSSILEGLNNYNKGEQDVSKRRSTMDTGGNITEPS
mgnify:CR=1 FL=1